MCAVALSCTCVHPNVSNVLTTSELYTTFKNGKDDASQPRAYFLTCEGARAYMRACTCVCLPMRVRAHLLD